ncbi:hypothetical protein Tco_0552912, partial [Tanacetum coccineum]
MSTYLKNMAGYKHNKLKNKSFDDIQKLFNKAIKRVNTFVDMDIELVEGSEVGAEGSETRAEGSSKRAGEELEHENAKKQKVDEDSGTFKLKRLMEVADKVFCIVFRATTLLLHYQYSMSFSYLVLLICNVTLPDTHYSAATQFGGVTDSVMSSVSSTVTYTSVDTDSEPGRAFWPADEELFDGGSPRVIVYGYDRLPIQPVAPPSPDYIPGPEDPQAPLVPQNEDEREPMFVQAHDPDYVPEPIYPEYIPLEDEHVFPAWEWPLPHVDSPTALSPGCVADSDPEEDFKEEHADYPANGGDDDDDDTDNKDEDPFEDEEEEGEEEEHLAPADPSDVLVVDHVLSARDTEALEADEPAPTPPSPP